MLNKKVEYLLPVIVCDICKNKVGRLTNYKHLNGLVCDECINVYEIRLSYRNKA